MAKMTSRQKCNGLVADAASIAWEIKDSMAVLQPGWLKNPDVANAFDDLAAVLPRKTGPSPAKSSKTTLSERGHVALTGEFFDTVMKANITCNVLKQMA